MSTVAQTETAARNFDAVVTREGRWWLITVEALDAVTQARSLREVPEMAEGLVSALLDVEPSAVTVALTFTLPPDVAADWNTAADLHQQARDAEERSAALRRQAVRTLLADTSLSQADAGAMLGLSKQRVQQLAS
jgi:hypothetical protein